VKRYRANREANLTVAERLGSVGFNGSNVNRRRDSGGSKASRQVNVTQWHDVVILFLIGISHTLYNCLAH